MDTFEKIRALLAEQLDIDPEKITPDSDIMSDFEADSLDIVDMVMTLEDEFGIEVPDDAIESPCSAAPGCCCRRGFILVRAERAAFGARPWEDKTKWQKTTRSSCRRSPARKRTLHSGTPTSA